MHGFESKRNGTLSLFPALNTVIDEVLGETAVRHTSVQFVAFLVDNVGVQAVCDNESKSQDPPAVQTYLAEHANVAMHCTLTHARSHNQIEN